MFSILPDLTPRDSHSLWYTSSRNPLPPPEHAGAHNLDPGTHDGGPPHHHHHRRQHGSAQALLERSALGRLRADEAYQERRRHNVGNFGSTWLKPPGIAKSLFQLREERREQEEHAEAVRREQLAQQLAEAEEGAAAAAAAAGLVAEDGQLAGEMDVMEEGEDGEGGGGGAGPPEERDLDDDIPDADAEGFGYDGTDTDEEGGENEDSDDEAGDRSSAGGADGGPADELRNVIAAEDRVLSMMSRGQARQQATDDMLYGGEEDEVDEEVRAEMLQEDDLVHPRAYGRRGGRGGLADGADDDGEMDMDGDLDDEIPEAESGLYEHTDTEASLSSSDDERPETSFALGQPSASSQFRGDSARAQRRGVPQAARSSLDISSILSRDGSSMAGSSPHIMRRH